MNRTTSANTVDLAISDRSVTGALHVNPMNILGPFLFICLICCQPVAVSGAIFEIEPDDFDDGTVLNTIHPRVDLAIHDGISTPDFPTDFGIFPAPAIIPVTALTNEDIFGGYFTSTGTKTFGHAGVDFTPLSRAIGMRFNGSAMEVSIDVIGTNDLTSTVGVLEIYDAGGNLLDSVNSSELLRQDVETLSISRPTFDIAFARAYSDSDFNPFGSFDRLRFTAVPEPTSSLAGLAMGTVALARRRRRS